MNGILIPPLCSQTRADFTNLKKFNFPQATPRRQRIAADYDIVLLLGDNLNDFSDVFERKSEELRFAAVDNLETTWGSRFIVIPNPMYGDWINAVLGYQPLTGQSRQEALEQSLIGIKDRVAK